jgi:hypothetical protein
MERLLEGIQPFSRLCCGQNFVRVVDWLDLIIVLTLQQRWEHGRGGISRCIWVSAQRASLHSWRTGQAQRGHPQRATRGECAPEPSYSHLCEFECLAGACSSLSEGVAVSRPRVIAPSTTFHPHALTAQSLAGQIQRSYGGTQRDKDHRTTSPVTRLTHAAPASQAAFRRPATHSRPE